MSQTVDLEHVVTLSEACRLLNATPYQIVYLIRSRKVPEVRMLGHRRVFTAEELQGIQEALVCTYGIRHRRSA